MEHTKQLLSIAIYGNLDDVAIMKERLRFELGGLDNRHKEKLRRESEGSGFSAFQWYLQRLKSDRDNGVTIASRSSEFFTESKQFYVCDGPGHGQFIKNVIRGAALVDVALLLVPVDGFCAEEVKKESRILCLLGLKQLIVGIHSKMGEYGEERFSAIAEEVVMMLLNVGWGDREQIKKGVCILPVSSLMADNMLALSPGGFPWWNGVEVEVPSEGGKAAPARMHVFSLLDALDKVIGLQDGDPAAQLRVPISGVYRIKGLGDVLTGLILQGVARPDAEVLFIPSHSKASICSGNVRWLEIGHKIVPEAGPRNSVGFVMRDLSKSNLPRLGDVMVSKSDPFEAARVVEARIHEFSECQAGDILVCFVGTAKSPVKVVKVVRQEQGATVMVTLEATERGMACETVQEARSSRCPNLTTVGLMKGVVWIGIGFVEWVEWWSARSRRAVQAALFVMAAFRKVLSRDVSRIIAEMILNSKAESCWSRFA